MTESANGSGGDPGTGRWWLPAGSLLASGAVVAVIVMAAAESEPGTDAAFARDLWSSLEGARMVGADAIKTRPYEGTEPHGAILEYLEHPVAVNGREGRAIVKKNYGGEQATIPAIWGNGREHLMSVTVMFQREAGYDPAHQNWYWAKYGPDGSVEAAGKVDMCINCHQAAPGGDFIYSY